MVNIIWDSIAFAPLSAVVMIGEHLKESTVSMVAWVLRLALPMLLASHVGGRVFVECLD